MADIPEILEALKYFRSPFPSAGVAEAIAHQDEITPHLLTILEETADNPDAFGQDPDRCDHLFALFLLAKFREERAWPLIVRIVSAADSVDDVLGGVITQSLPAIMASVCGGDIAGIKALIENRDGNEWVRGAALGSITRLVAANRFDRDEAMRYVGGLFHTLDRDTEQIWTALVANCLELYPEEVAGDIAQVYEDGLIEDFILPRDEARRTLALGRDAAIKKLKEYGALIDNVEDEMSWMSGFEPDSDPEPIEPPASARERFALAPPQPPYYVPERVKQVVRSGPKIGRNDPCHCGSLKKYKKCCGA